MVNRRPLRFAPVLRVGAGLASILALGDVLIRSDVVPLACLLGICIECTFWCKRLAPLAQGPRIRSGRREGLVEAAAARRLWRQGRWRGRWRGQRREGVRNGWWRERRSRRTVVNRRPLRFAPVLRVGAGLASILALGDVLIRSDVVPLACLLGICIECTFWCKRLAPLAQGPRIRSGRREGLVEAAGRRIRNISISIRRRHQGNKYDYDGWTKRPHAFCGHAQANPVSNAAGPCGDSEEHRKTVICNPCGGDTSATSCFRYVVGKSRHRAHTESQREESGESQFQGSLWRATLSVYVALPNIPERELSLFSPYVS